MRVCIINEFFYPDDGGGTGTVLSEMADALRRDHPGVEIDVVTSNNLYRDKAAKLPAYEEWNGIRIFRLDTPHPGGLPALRRMAVNLWFGLLSVLKLLGLRRYDLLLIGTAPPTVAVAADLYRTLRRVPYLYVVYDLEPDRALALGLLSPRHPLTGLLRAGQRRWLHGAARVVVLGRCMRDHVCRTYRLPADRVEVIPIGADADAIRPQDKRTRFRAAHGLGGFVVGYAGNFGRYHNFDTLLDAARRLRDTEPAITFVLTGGGAQKAHILRRVAAEGLHNVRVLPFLPKADYPDLLASADVSLVTLEPGMEGLCVPSKFYSILASGRPTVAMVSPDSEVALTIGEWACGVQVAQGDTDRLVAVLADLARRPDEVAAMGRNARAALVRGCDSRQIAGRYYRAMRAAVGDSLPAPSPVPVHPLPASEPAYSPPHVGLRERAAG